MTEEGSGTGGDGSGASSGGPRVPAILMVPVGLAVGWMVAQWLGAILGGVLGVFLWRSRA
jgi:hypothetical protein